MNHAVLVLAALLGVASCWKTPFDFLDYRLTQGGFVRECSSPGLMCEDCTHVVSCIAGDDGRFTKLPISVCSAGTTCLGNKCTTKRNPPCEVQLPFVCGSSGLYPDQYECRKYHFCVPAEDNSFMHFVATCEAGFAYHAGAKDCRRPLKNNVCFEDLSKFPVPLCETGGQSEGLDENETLYYMCAQYNSTVTELYPFLYSCPRGAVYKNYQCVLPPTN